MTLQFSNLNKFSTLFKLNSNYCLNLVRTCITPNELEQGDVVNLKNKSSIERNRIFDEEILKRKQALGRLEKINVKAVDIKPFSDLQLLMNKNISTPYDCAKHIGELFVQRSVIAKVDDQEWDMHRNLEKDCTISFLNFNQENNYQVNKAFWRSCSFLLGKVIERSFKGDIPVILHSWPKPNIKSGSFIYDVKLPTLENWKPRESELLTLTKAFWALHDLNFKFERLDSSIETAKKIFSNNEFKLKQLNQIEETNKESRIILYRVGKYIDFSVGPMIPSTKFLGRVSVTAVHQINASCGKLYRFQGVAVPTQLPMHFYAFNILCKKAKNLNISPVP